MTIEEQWANVPKEKRWSYAEKICNDCNIISVVAVNAQRCKECNRKIKNFRSNNGVKARAIMTKDDSQKVCFFCKATSKSKKIDIHHIDKNPANNERENLMFVCYECHRKLHGFIYNPLLKRFFHILKGERFTYEQMAKMFGMTRQNVHNIAQSWKD